MHTWAEIEKMGNWERGRVITSKRQQGGRRPLSERGKGKEKNVSKRENKGKENGYRGGN